jgi:hypothetical protein
MLVLPSANGLKLKHFGGTLDMLHMPQRTKPHLQNIFFRNISLLESI